jgi:hypothetical protein
MKQCQKRDSSIKPGRQGVRSCTFAGWRKRRPNYARGLVPLLSVSAWVCFKLPFGNYAQAAHHHDAGQNGNPSGSDLPIDKQQKGSDQFKVDTTDTNIAQNG